MKRKRSTKANRKLPYLAIAVICENVLQDADNINSVIRIFDVIKLEGPSKSMPTGIVKFHVFIMFRAGEALGRRKIKLVPTTPSGDTGPIQEKEVDFLGNESSSALNIQVQMAVKEIGVYWFDVQVNSTLATRIPLHIRYSQIRAQPKSRSKKKKSTPRKK